MWGDEPASQPAEAVQAGVAEPIESEVATATPTATETVATETVATEATEIALEAGDAAPVGPWAGAPRRATAPEDPAESAPPAGTAVTWVTEPIPIPPPVPAPTQAVDDHAVIWVPDRDRTAPPVDGSALDAWLKTPVPRRRGARVTAPDKPKTRRRKPLRRPGSGLAALVPLSLLAAFFAWVSVEPMWLAVGHGDRGTATVTRCTGEGVGQRCVGEFTAAGGAFTVPDVAMLGVPAEHRRVGASMTARMVSSDSRSAYASDRTGLHLRWVVGLALVLVCGLGIAIATGATRLDDRRARLGAFATSLAAPLLIAVGFLAASY